MSLSYTASIAFLWTCNITHVLLNGFLLCGFFSALDFEGERIIFYVYSVFFLFHLSFVFLFPFMNGKRNPKTAPFALYRDITNTQERRFVHLEPAAQARNPSIRLKDHSAHIFHALHEFVRSQIAKQKWTLYRWNFSGSRGSFCVCNCVKTEWKFEYMHDCQRRRILIGNNEHYLPSAHSKE